MTDLLTKYQRWTLEEIRKYCAANAVEWFEPYELPYIIKRQEFVCDTLKVKGFLERRYRPGFAPPLYRIIPQMPYEPVSG